MREVVLWMFLQPKLNGVQPCGKKVYVNPYRFFTGFVQNPIDQGNGFACNFLPFKLLCYSSGYWELDCQFHLVNSSFKGWRFSRLTFWLAWIRRAQHLTDNECSMKCGMKAVPSKKIEVYSLVFRERPQYSFACQPYEKNLVKTDRFTDCQQICR